MLNVKQMTLYLSHKCSWASPNTDWRSAPTPWLQAHHDASVGCDRSYFSSNSIVSHPTHSPCNTSLTIFSLSYGVCISFPWIWTNLRLKRGTHDAVVGSKARWLALGSLGMVACETQSSLPEGAQAAHGRPHERSQSSQVKPAPT